MYEKLIPWVENTIAEIKELLEANNIPYVDHGPRDETEYASSFYTHQLTFPWDDGDVVVGTLHCLDDKILLEGKTDKSYPSIETYCFPWDGDDITVFETPRDFVDKLSKYYKKEEYEGAQCMETKLWRIMHLFTCEDWNDTNMWDTMVAEECAIVECTEEQVKEICDKATPIKDDDDYIFNKFIYFEVKPVETFDPEQWIIAEKSSCKLHIPIDVYKQLSKGTIDGYADDDGWRKVYSCKDWDYKQALNELGFLQPETHIDFDYIKGGNGNA